MPVALKMAGDERSERAPVNDNSVEPEIIGTVDEIATNLHGLDTNTTDARMEEMEKLLKAAKAELEVRFPSPVLVCTSHIRPLNYSRKDSDMLGNFKPIKRRSHSRLRLSGLCESSLTDFTLGSGRP